MINHKEKHLIIPLSEFEKSHILKIWVEGTLKYGDVLAFLISDGSGKKYVKRGFFYNYLLADKSDIKKLQDFCLFEQFEKYILWMEDESPPSKDVIQAYESETGLSYPKPDYDFVRLYYNNHTIQIRDKGDKPVPSSRTSFLNTKRRESSKTLSQLITQREREQLEYSELRVNQREEWHRDNPWAVQGNPLEYTTNWKPHDAKNFKRQLVRCKVKTFEGELDQISRFLEDHHNEYPFKQIEDLTVLFFDIETNDEHPGPLIIGEHEILSWSYSDFDDYKEFGEDSIIHESTEDRHSEESEKQLLLKIKETFSKYDVILGWNSSGFDVPYIQIRFENHKIFFDWRMLYSIDLMRDIYKQFYSSDKGDDSMGYGLEAMAQVVLGIGKVKHQGKIHYLYDQNKELLKKYNNRDVSLMCDLEIKNGFLYNYFNICKTSNVDYEPKGNFNKVKSDFVEMASDHKYWRIPDKTYEERQAIQNFYEKATGAFVTEPVSGIHENVIAVDVGSLYPSTMQTFNICLSTYIPKEDWHKWEEGTYCETPNNIRFRTDRIGYLPRMFSMIKKMRKHYQKEMKRIKEEGKIESNEYAVASSLEYAWKAKGLSIYGALGVVGGMLFNVDLVEAVTLTGQYYLSESIKTLYGNKVHRHFTNQHDLFCSKFQVPEGQEPENEVVESDYKTYMIYTDTDSIYISVQSTPTQDISKLEQKSEAWVEALNETADHIMDQCHKRYREIDQERNAIKGAILLDFEQIYSKMMFMKKKKRYAGNLAWHKGSIIKGDQITFKGLEVRRRDGIVISKQHQESIVRGILTNSIELNEVQDKILDLRKYILGEKDTYPTFEELKKSQGTKSLKEYKSTNYSLAVRIVIAEQMAGKRIAPGDSISYVVTRGSKEGDRETEGIIEDKYNQIIEKSGYAVYDAVYYWNAIFAPIERVLEVVYPDLDWSTFRIEQRARNMAGKNFKKEIQEYIEIQKQSAKLFSI
jgi:DNA polymerase elongation subunit (family B)